MEGGCQVANRYQGERHAMLIRLPNDLYELLGTEAQRAGISLNAYIVRLVLLGRAQVPGIELLRIAGQSAQGCKQPPH